MNNTETYLKEIQESAQAIQQKLFLISGQKELTNEQAEMANDAREGFDFWRRRMFKPLSDSFLKNNDKY